MLIGVDFDNTIAGYDHLFLGIAQEQGLLPAGFRGNKKSVRDAIRRLENGERRWTELQGVVYGQRMPQARMIEGVEPFLVACREHGIAVRIVSHKTRHAALDPLKVDLHQASRAWMEAQDIFGRLGVARDAVFFEPTRQDKCRRIAVLGVSHFIDDLEEVFHEPEFPPNVERYLLSAEEEPGPGPFHAFRTWAEIQRDILGRA